MTPTIRKTLLALMTDPGLTENEQAELFRLAQRPTDPVWISESEAAKLLGISDRQLAAWATGKLTYRYGSCPLSINTPRVGGGARRYNLCEVRKLRDKDTVKIATSEPTEEQHAN